MKPSVVAVTPPGQHQHYTEVTDTALDEASTAPSRDGERVPNGGAEIVVSIATDCGDVGTARPRVTWIMLNPRAPDARTDDATIRRYMAFADLGTRRDRGRGVCALRATAVGAARAAIPSAQNSAVHQATVARYRAAKAI
jgi:hypothetical protein